MQELHAVFEKILDGKRLVEKLRKMGYKAHLDIADGFGSEFAAEMNFSGRKGVSSLSAHVLKTDRHITDSNKGSLSASSPFVSGYGSYWEAESTNTKLMVKVDDEKADEIKNLIASHGGKL